MKKVTVVMSSYNGGHYIIQQLDSIFAQKDVDVICFVRDDGSKDDTLQILKEYQEKLSEGTLIVEHGDNVGWERSFLLSLRGAPKADYYAFADQDDIWFDDKLISGIKMMEESPYKDKPLMYHCNKLSVKENMKPLSHQVRRTPQPLNRKNAIIQEYAQGCSIIINENARRLVTKHLPERKIAHDFWCGLLCYLFGKVIYDNNPHFYHISHGNNASGEGHMIKSWKERLKKFYNSSSVYYIPTMDILKGYESYLTEEDLRFFKILTNYKRCWKDKISLLFSFHFIRDSIIGTISLKVAILLNKL